MEKESVVSIGQDRCKGIKPAALFAAVGDIREEYIEEAAVSRRHEKIPRYWVVLAACLAAAVSVGFMCVVLLYIYAGGPATVP